MGGLLQWSSDAGDGLSGYAVAGASAVGDIILAEVLQGFRNDRDFDRVGGAIDFSDSDQSGAGHRSAQNYRYLRKQSITIRKTIDCLSLPSPSLPGMIPASDRD
jgi:hypothetical protein